MDRTRHSRRMHESGASAVEYSMLAVAIAAVIVIIVFALGRMTQGSYATTCSNLKGEMSTSETCS